MTKDYAVRVYDEETQKHEREYVGPWANCIRHAHNLISMAYPYSTNTNGMPDELHIQGDEIDPGYVGYGRPNSWGGLLWIVVDDANPPPPVEHEPFDYDGAIRESAQLMLVEITKPENVDLMEAVKGVGSHDGPNGNFMRGFTWTEPKSFSGDDEYVETLIERNKQVPLNREQTERWDVIVAVGDKHGHSGASYGVACRHLQSLLEGNV